MPQTTTVMVHVDIGQICRCKYCRSTSDPQSLTNPQYWDCNCRLHYIHKKKDELFCSKCGADEEEQPDSHTVELKNEENLYVSR